MDQEIKPNSRQFSLSLHLFEWFKVDVGYSSKNVSLEDGRGPKANQIKDPANKTKEKNIGRARTSNVNAGMQGDFED
jgi:hypothetical protein